MIDVDSNEPTHVPTRTVTTDEAAGLTDAVRALITAVEFYRHRAASDAGLRISEAQAVSTIGQRQTLSQIELAHQLGLTSGATTGLVDRLERAGVVERLRDTADRRRNQIQLTAQGRELIRTSGEWLGHALDGIDRAEQATLASQLMVVADNLRQVGNDLGGADPVSLTDHAERRLAQAAV